MYCYIPFDLHVLSTPPAFILSQDQTLRKKITLSSVSYGFSSRQGLSFSSYHFSVVKVLLTERELPASCRPVKAPERGTIIPMLSTSAIRLLLPLMGFSLFSCIDLSGDEISCFWLAYLLYAFQLFCQGPISKLVSQRFQNLLLSTAKRNYMHLSHWVKPFQYHFTFFKVKDSTSLR